MPRRYRDRTAAGHALASALRERGTGADLVLAIPRGGVPLGRVVADALEIPLDVVVAKKIGAPDNPEYAIGAVASDGSVWRNEDALARVDEGYFENHRRRVATEAREKETRYRAGRRAPRLAGQDIILVDDGVATGATVQACLDLLRQAGAHHIVLAVPVGPPDTIDELDALADEVVCPLTPSSFRGVGQFYERFDQVSDEAAIAALRS